MKDYIRRIDKKPKVRVSFTWTEETYEMFFECSRRFYERRNRSEFSEHLMKLGMKAYLDNLKWLS